MGSTVVLVACWNDRMNEDECLARFGLRPVTGDLPAIRDILSAHSVAERRAQGEGDTDVMKLCCVQLFHSGDLSDVLRIWTAKRCSMDSNGAIDVQLLCGHGLDGTEKYLAAQHGDAAAEALDYLRQCEAAGDFEEFDLADYSAGWHRWYRIGA